MSKVTLSFTLPEEQYEFEAASKGSAAFGALSDIREMIRGEIKYKNNTSLEDLYREVCEICADVGVP